MSAYYAGQRRFALGGKGWTLVLGSTFSLAYVRFRAKLSDEDRAQEYHKLLDERGQQVKFHDQSSVSKEEDIVLRIWRQMPSTPLPNLYVAAGLLTAFWAYRVGRTFNALMIVRYSDIHYQLKRPDVLANKVVALKYLALPLAIIPVGVGACALLGGVGRDGGESFLTRRAADLKATLAGPVHEASLAVRNAVTPISQELSESPLAIFAQRSQTVGRPISMVERTPGSVVSPPPGWKP
eukprot:TRINITY_DN31050_c0_g1_i1.p1 TRINITY_DN31050_c0_g1~~TRINITY_DN31050_c0_g1_i1.p1  ORF type:complete len:238 (-),score=38.57 TRINITY_DN31050_c0_g1_i1:103-816(-)